MFASKLRFLPLKIKSVQNYKSPNFFGCFSTSQNNSSAKHTMNNLDYHIKSSKYSRDYLADLVRQEIKVYIHQRNKEMRFTPHELDLNILQGKNAEKNSEIVKLFGDYFHSQETSYWSGISNNTTFNKLHLIKPELELIIFAIFKRLELRNDIIRSLRENKGIEENNSIQDAIEYVEEVVNSFDKEKNFV